MPNSSRSVEREFQIELDQGDASGFGWAANLIADLSCFFEVNGLSSTGRELRSVLETLSVETPKQVVRPKR